MAISRLLGVTRLCLAVRQSVFSSRAASTVQIPTTKLFINNEFLESETEKWINVRNPATNEVISKVPESTTSEMEAAVAAAKAAFPAWSRSTILFRQQIMFRLRDQLIKNRARLRDSLVLEIGKTKEDADEEIGRCIQILEHCCSITTLQTGETLPDIAQDMNILTFRLPLGVTAGITPFNFPAMVPISIFSMSTVCGNTCVIKPSSCDPGAVMILMELCLKAGCPPGVVNVIHGRKEPVTFVCDHPDVVALSFVGSDEAGSYVYERGAKNGKRVQCNLGAKNHALVMPDANKERTLSSLISGSFGAAGQRCMALSTAIFVGDSKQWIPELVERSKTQKVTSGAEPGADFGPLISPEAKKRVCDLIQSGVDAGAKLLLDGRNIKVKGYENGNFLGPTILHRVYPTMECYTTEIYGPVLATMEVDTLDDAINIVRTNPYGNTTAIFTASGATARKYSMKCDVGMVGINVAIPFPINTFSFTGSKGSFKGDLRLAGKEAIQFFTQTRTVMEFWRE